MEVSEDIIVDVTHIRVNTHAKYFEKVVIVEGANTGHLELQDGVLSTIGVNTGDALWLFDGIVERVTAS